MSAGTTQDERHHASLNSQFRRTTTITAALLTAQVRIWLIKEMFSRLAVLERTTTRRYSKPAITTMALGALNIVFSKATWGRLLKSPWQVKPASPERPAKASHKRRGASEEQQKLWDLVRAKATHGKRPRIFA